MAALPFYQLIKLSSVPASVTASLNKEVTIENEVVQLT